MRSVYWKSFIMFTLVMIFAIVAFGGMFLYQVNRYSVDEKLEAIRANCAVVSDLTANYLDNQTPLNARAYCNTLMYLAGLSDYRIVVTTPTGEMIVAADGGSYSVSDVQISSKVVNEVIANGESRFAGDMGGYYSVPMFTVGITVKDFQGSLMAVVFVSTEGKNLYSLYSDIFGIIALSAQIVFIAGMVFTSVVVRTTSRPLRQIGDAARSFARGDFSVRVAVRGRNEISELAETFNGMAQSLAEYDQSRQEFLANIAHELRTPMTTIAGYVDGILDGTVPHEKEEEYLHVISGEVRRLSRLISSILMLSRVQSGNEPMNRADFNLCELAGQVMLGFEHEVGKSNITVEADFADYGLIVNADRDAITRVIHNLFGNAVKFTPEGGRIDVRIAARGNKATVSVRNTGEGISEDDLPYIFDRFFKSDRSRGMESSSTGLGLSICKSIIAAHGEEIWAESAAGQYAEFFFTLPVSKRLIEPFKN